MLSLYPFSGLLLPFLIVSREGQQLFGVSRNRLGFRQGEGNFGEHEFSRSLLLS